MTQLDRQYQQVLKKILTEGVEELNERTGHKVKILPGVAFEITQGFPFLTSPYNSAKLCADRIAGVTHFVPRSARNLSKFSLRVTRAA